MGPLSLTGPRRWILAFVLAITLTVAVVHWYSPYDYKDFDFRTAASPVTPPPTRNLAYDAEDGWLQFDPSSQTWGKPDEFVELPPPPPGRLPPPPTLPGERIPLDADYANPQTVTTTVYVSTHTGLPEYAHFAPPEDTAQRASDRIDTFAEYRGRDECGFGSTDLHLPFSPLCKTKDEVLDAMSYGGRAGFDTAFIPLGCDMRWYSAKEIREILNRFSYVYFMGDSIQRMLVSAFYVLLRGNLAYGAISDWKFEELKQEVISHDPNAPHSLEDCYCEKQFATKACSEMVIKDSQDLLRNDVQFSRDELHLSTNIQYHWFAQWPFEPFDMQRMTDGLPQERPSKPAAFIVHHTLWNDVNITESNQAIIDWREKFKADIPWLRSEDAFFPKLFTSVNAGGMIKAPWYLGTQGNQQLGNFEHEMIPRARQAGYDFLGMYNMSLQSTQFDGSHANFQTNLIKMQMIFNWLDKLDVSQWDPDTMNTHGW